MEFYPERCNVLRITWKKSKITFPFSLHGHVLEEVASAKYLSITMMNDMTRNEHIGKTASKANKKLGFLCRNIETRDQSLRKKLNSQFCISTVLLLKLKVEALG